MNKKTEVDDPQGLHIRASQLACMMEHAKLEDPRWLDALRQGAENVRAALGTEPLAVLKGYLIRQDLEKFIESPDGPLPYIYKNPTASPCVAISALLLWDKNAPC